MCVAYIKNQLACTQPCLYIVTHRLLHTLRMRYSLDMIYTYSANILIACNPHKRLRTLYGGKMMRQYKDKQLGELAPHVYAIAEQVWDVDGMLMWDLVCIVVHTARRTYTILKYIESVPLTYAGIQSHDDG